MYQLVNRFPDAKVKETYDEQELATIKTSVLITVLADAVNILTASDNHDIKIAHNLEEILKHVANFSGKIKKNINELIATSKEASLHFTASADQQPACFEKLF